MQWNYSILPPHIRQATFASDYAKKSQARVNFNYWVADGSENWFRTFQLRNSIFNGRRTCGGCQCSTTSIIFPQPTISTTTEPEEIYPAGYLPLLEENAARIKFTTQFASIPSEFPVIQVTANTNFAINFYLGRTPSNSYGTSSNSGSFMYTLQNTYLNYNNSVYFDVLSNIENIRSIIYNRGGIRQIANLNALYNLQELILDSNRLLDLNNIRYNSNLTTLYLRYNQIANIAPLQYLTKMEHLYLSNNSISDISPLQTMNSLEIIEINNNSISSIASLAGKNSLITIIMQLTILLII